MKQTIIIFDGVCNFCNSSVIFIIKRDPNSHFLFTPLQSNSAKELIIKYKVNNYSIGSIILIKDDKYFLKSDAIFEIIKELTGYWYLFKVCKIIPLFIRDFFYNLISKNRYRFFGKKDSCMILTKDLQKRFLD